MLFIFHLTDGLLGPQPKLKKSFPSHNPLQPLLTGFSDYRTLSKLSLPKYHLKHVNKELHSCFQTLDSFSKDFLVKHKGYTKICWMSKRVRCSNKLQTKCFAQTQTDATKTKKAYQEICLPVPCISSSYCCWDSTLIDEIFYLRYILVAM